MCLKDNPSHTQPEEPTTQGGKATQPSVRSPGDEQNVPECVSVAVFEAQDPGVPGELSQ